MNAIAIITVVVVAVLTVVVFCLAWIAYGSCIKAYGIETGQGIHDPEIYGKYRAKRKMRKGEAVGLVASYTVITALLALFVVGIVYKARGENLEFGGQTALVVKSGSMSDFHDEDLRRKYEERGYDTTLQFGVGDICLYESLSRDDGLTEGQVYAYRYKNSLITHRLVSVRSDGTYEFRGDNNPVSDGMGIPRDAVEYRYTGNKVPGLGSFVLYAQSLFGLWSLVGVVGVAVGSDVARRRMSSIEEKRYRELCPEGQRDDWEYKNHEE